MAWEAEHTSSCNCIIPGGQVILKSEGIKRCMLARLAASTSFFCSRITPAPQNTVLITVYAPRKISSSLSEPAVCQSRGIISTPKPRRRATSGFSIEFGLTVALSLYHMIILAFSQLAGKCGIRKSPRFQLELNPVKRTRQFLLRR